MFIVVILPKTCNCLLHHITMAMKNYYRRMASGKGPRIREEGHFTFHIIHSIFFLILESFEIKYLFQKNKHRDFPCSPRVKNLPCSVRDARLIPGVGQPHMLRGS